MRNNTPRIGILMSCYNHEKYVNDAMDSILRQTYENWELYVVNDGSTDRSGEILASYTDERIHFYDFKENTKFAGALEFLQDILRDADVEYISVMSSDDMWEESKLEKQMEIFKKYPEYKACLTWDKVFFETTEKGVYENNELYSHETNRNRYEWISYMFRRGNCFNECSLVMPKQIFYELGALNQHFRQLGDFHMWYKIALKYPFYLMEEELTYYRRHESNLSEVNKTVVMRSTNEYYQIMKELAMTIDKDLFHRIFYRSLPYVECKTEEEFIAEKFILFVGSNDFIKQQVAMDIYFEHCHNRAFVSVLEEKYFFYEENLLNLLGGCGLQTSFCPSIRKVMFFSPISTLTNAINKKKLTEDMLDTYRYSVLFDLWDVTNRVAGGREQFDNVCNFVMNIQKVKWMHREKERVLFLIAQDSQWDCMQLIKEKQKEHATCYVAFVPTIVDAMHRGYDGNQQKKQIEGAEILDLYDEREHCLRFLHELSKEADSIYYVDCLDNRYECGAMAAGYSLSVAYHAVLREDIYQHMLQNQEHKILEMMSNIERY